MKKVLSMILAMATVASMASVAFAAPNEDVKFNGTDVYTTNADGLVDKTNLGTIKVAKGDSLYLPLTIKSGTTNSQVSKWHVKADWLVGADLLEASPSLVYKKTTAADAYEWFVELKTKEAFDTSLKDLLGTIKVYKTSASSATEAQTRKLEYGTLGKDAVSYDGTNALTMDTTAVVSFANNKNYSDAEETIEFEGIGSFEVDVYEQGKLYLGWDVDFNSDVADLYPSANLEFVNFKAAPKFNKRGVMHLFAEEGTFLYSLTDGKLAKVEATYDAEDEAFKFGTKQLSTFVISDVELDVAVFNNAADKEDEVVDAPVVDKENPDTGR